MSEKHSGMRRALIAGIPRQDGLYLLEFFRQTAYRVFDLVRGQSNLESDSFSTWQDSRRPRIVRLRPWHWQREGHAGSRMIGTIEFITYVHTRRILKAPMSRSCGRETCALANGPRSSVST
jgi:hypothetical protein